MTAAQWAAANGIVGRRWVAQMDRYLFDLNTGESIPVNGEDFYAISRHAIGVFDEENAIAHLVRDKWLDLQRHHFERAHARGGYC